MHQFVKIKIECNKSTAKNSILKYNVTYKTGLAVCQTQLTPRFVLIDAVQFTIEWINWQNSVGKIKLHQVHALHSSKNKNPILKKHLFILWKSVGTSVFRI